MSQLCVAHRGHTFSDASHDICIMLFSRRVPGRVVVRDSAGCKIAASQTIKLQACVRTFTGSPFFQQTISCQGHNVRPLKVYIIIIMFIIMRHLTVYNGIGIVTQRFRLRRRRTREFFVYFSFGCLTRHSHAQENR